MVPLGRPFLPVVRTSPYMNDGPIVVSLLRRFSTRDCRFMISHRGHVESREDLASPFSTAQVRSPNVSGLALENPTFANKILKPTLDILLTALSLDSIYCM
jgi:hypothetical protein